MTRGNRSEGEMEAGGEDGAFERVRLGGRNRGASMSVSHGCEGKLQNCCCINIYVNSNIQGVNNSTLNGSEVKMGSPGVCFFFGDIEPKSHQNNRSVHQYPKLWQWSLMLLVLVVLLFLLVLEMRMFHS